MTREEAKVFIKGQLESYLKGKGIKTSKPFICLNPEHSDRKPSMSYDRKRNKAHCFSCGADYDTLDIIGIDYGLSDSKEIFNKAFELFNISIENDSQPRENAPGYQDPPKSEQSTHNDIHTTVYTHTQEKPAQDFTDYFKEAQSYIKGTDYPQQRGLTEATIERFKLGYDSHYTRATGGAVWQALIIPTGKGSFTARNTAQGVDKKDRIRKTGSNPLYNTRALREAKKPIFIVEGELDALSIIDVGGEAIALGSTANYRALLRLLESQPPAQPLLISLDTDTEGQKTEEELIKELTGRNIAFYKVNIAGEYKDANEALQVDREAFKVSVQAAENIEQEADTAEREAYLSTSAKSHLKSFMDGIEDSVDTPFIPTDFPMLDKYLDGGLFEGFYILGAISSLGKTTMVMQIADQIAQSGQDVLIFSMEMARTELMAKSISRHTLLNVLENQGNIRNAKTARGITTGSRYENYSDTEKALIISSIAAYDGYADHIFISEGVGNIGAAQIREQVKKHLHFTGRKPVVIIDYLQILAPYSERATDKQNTDKAVMELKRISRDYKIPVIGISSFNRLNYKSPVTMEAFKESGAIEYSSDVLIGLQLKGVGKDGFDVDKEKDKNPREIELVILKNRNGATGKKVAYKYYPLFNHFIEERAKPETHDNA
jgi:replicative DNA helicase